MDNSEILRKFRDEVLQSGPESTLPKNLSDYWLGALQQHLDDYLEGVGERDEEDDEAGSSMSLPLAAIIHILFAKNGGEAVSYGLEEMFENFQNYRIELALEEINRKTDMKSAPATLQTIFTNRDVEFPPMQ